MIISKFDAMPYTISSVRRMHWIRATNITSKILTRYMLESIAMIDLIFLMKIAI
jgi:hypothetical protein